MYNVLEAREVVPYFLEWGFDSETIAELDHDKGIYFYKTQKRKYYQKMNRKTTENIKFWNLTTLFTDDLKIFYCYDTT